MDVKDIKVGSVYFNTVSWNLYRVKAVSDSGLNFVVENIESGMRGLTCCFEFAKEALPFDGFRRLTDEEYTGTSRVFWLDKYNEQTKLFSPWWTPSADQHLQIFPQKLFRVRLGAASVPAYRDLTEAEHRCIPAEAEVNDHILGWKRSACRGEDMSHAPLVKYRMPITFPVAQPDEDDGGPVNPNCSGDYAPDWYAPDWYTTPPPPPVPVVPTAVVAKALSELTSMVKRDPHREHREKLKASFDVDWLNGSEEGPDYTVKVVRAMKDTKLRETPLDRTLTIYGPDMWEE